MSGLRIHAPTAMEAMQDPWVGNYREPEWGSALPEGLDRPIWAENTALSETEISSMLEYALGYDIDPDLANEMVGILVQPTQSKTIKAVENIIKDYRSRAVSLIGSILEDPEAEDLYVAVSRQASKYERLIDDIIDAGVPKTGLIHFLKKEYEHKSDLPGGSFLPKSVKGSIPKIAPLNQIVYDPHAPRVRQKTLAELDEDFVQWEQERREAAKAQPAKYIMTLKGREFEINGVTLGELHADALRKKKALPVIGKLTTTGRIILHDLDIRPFEEEHMIKEVQEYLSALEAVENAREAGKPIAGVMPESWSEANKQRAKNVILINNKGA